MARIATAELMSEEDLILPDGYRPFTPPGAKNPVQIPTHIPTFRPLHGDDPRIRVVFDPFFKNTRKAAANRVGTDYLETSVDLSVPQFPETPLPIDNPAENASNTRPSVFTIHDDGRIQYLNLSEDADEPGTYFACDDNNEHLVDERGKSIRTDVDGFALPATTTRLQRWGAKLGNSDGRQGDADNPMVYTKEGIPIGTFDVVGVGQPPSDSKSIRGRKVLGITVASLAVVSVIGYLAGVGIGRSAVPAEGQITASEASSYHLSRFPVEAASAFGVHYLDLCLTHPQYKEDIDKRNNAMSTMEAPGVPEYCGWKQGGAAGGPSSVTFNGNVEEREEYGDGTVAYLDYFVTMQNGESFTATLPIWAGDNGAGRPAYSIVGAVGMSPATAVNINPDMTLGEPMDRELASAISPTLQTFFAAWGKGDAQALDTLLTTEADGIARIGLDGTVSDPTLDNVIVYPDNDPVSVSGQTATWDYNEGDRATAMVSLTWQVTDDTGGHEQPAGYRVPLVYQSGKWEVDGLQAGVVVPDGVSNGSETDPSAVVGDMVAKKPGASRETSPAGEQPSVEGPTGGFDTALE